MGRSWVLLVSAPPAPIVFDVDAQQMQDERIQEQFNEDPGDSVLVNRSFGMPTHV